MLNIALAKGRIGNQAYHLFSKIGYDTELFEESGRKLIITDEKKGFRYFLVKPVDVGIYVERGAADLGVVGKDTLLEYDPDVYELLDMKLGQCRIAVAGRSDFDPSERTSLRIATKYPNIAQKYYETKNYKVEIIRLNGSIEIAPLLDLSDVIVDIVETGGTLRENNLAVLEEIVPVSARLIANKASYKFKAKQIDMIRADLEKEINA